MKKSFSCVDRRREKQVKMASTEDELRREVERLTRELDQVRTISFAFSFDQGLNGYCSRFIFSRFGISINDLFSTS